MTTIINESIKKMDIDLLTEQIIGACYEVMNELGIGFSETVYKNAICIVLKQRGINVQGEVPLEVFFKGLLVGSYKADLIVEKTVIVELKCCKALLSEHQAQLINYLKATKLKVGLLINLGPKIEVKRLHG